jgi:PiT family inorganic phosphate transporter
MELERIHEIEAATWVNREEVLRLGISILFIVGIILYVSSRGEVSPMLVIAGMIGGYMALNIGANDVVNNVGPAVGSRALTLVGEALDQRDRAGVRGLPGVTGFMD